MCTRWYHFAATYDGTNALFYVDGVQQASQQYNLVLAAQQFRIGSGCQLGGSVCYSNNMLGWIVSVVLACRGFIRLQDDVVILNIAVPAAQIPLLKAGNYSLFGYQRMILRLRSRRL